MIIENTFDKLKLISELKEIHIELVEVYKKIFDYKYRTNADFEAFIDKEYKENKISDGEQQVWNDNFCHRASYTLLNKILFIRICEDKGFMLNPEDYVAGEPKDPHIGKKLSRIGLQKWANLVTNYTLGELVKLAFLDMKKSYGNIALYKDDKYEMLTPTTEELSLKYLDGDEEAQKLVLQFENALSNIVEKLDTNNYNFNNTDGNILGDVYEKFIDRETRKAIGQFYTPEFVIEYILNNTVAKADLVENPFVSVADISCGSGHFLIMAYDILREKFINNIELLRDKYANEVYTIKKNGKEEELTGIDYWKEENIHYHILKHCIYGADIDSFAVQLTTINLLLKDLDNFTDELNIVECDSLIKWEEDYDWKDLKQQLEEEFETIDYTQTNLIGEEEKFEVTNKKELFKLRYRDVSSIGRIEDIDRERAEAIVYLCEFWSKKFDYIVGNPPYVNVYSISPKNRDIYSNQNYQFMHMKYDLYILFFERAFLKLKLSGKLGFIVPYSFNSQKYGEKLREWILKNASIEHIVDYSEIPVFDAMVTGCSYIFRNSFVKNNKIKISKIKEKLTYFIEQNLFLEIPNNMFRIELTEVSSKIITKMKKNMNKVEDFCYVSMGAEVHSKENEKEKSRKEERISDKQINKDYKPFLEGLDIDKYIIKGVNKYVEYIPELMRRPKFPELFENEKLLVRNVTGKNGIIATIDKSNYYVDCTINCCVLGNKLKGVKQRVLQRKDFVNKVFEDINLSTLLAVLNAKSTNYYFLKYLGDNLHVNPNDIKNLPIPKMDEKVKNYLASCADEIMKLEIQKSIIKKDLYDALTVYDDLNQLINFIINIDEIDNKIDLIMSKIDWIIYKIYKFERAEIIEIERLYNPMLNENQINNTISMYLNISIEEMLVEKVEIHNINMEMLVDLLSKELPINLFISEHKNNNLTLQQIANKYGYELTTVFKLRDKHLREQSIVKNRIDLININYINETIIKLLIDHCLICIKEHMNFVDINYLKEILQERINNFDSIIDIFRIDSMSLKTLNIISSILKDNGYIWNAYRKDKAKNKQNKTFVKYYDNDYYGLAEWSDEIHKNYFLDAIEEYTINNPNEKKAKDILKLFKDLDIEDKEDYIEVIEEKIRKTFK